MVKIILKHLWLSLAPTISYNAKTPVWVVGCQRSGTTMLLNVLGRSPEVCIYQESNRKAFDEYRRLWADDTVQRLIRESRKRIVAFKPLNDSQHTDRLLKLHLNAKAIWVYRRYQDTVNSAIKKWGAVWEEIMYGISKGYYKKPGRRAIGERMSPQTVALVKKFCSKDLSAEDGAALLWYVRNSIYFDLNFQNNPKVLLCKYEDLVTKPEQHFQRIFDFLGCDFSHKFIDDVHASSIRKDTSPTLDPEIESLCEGMMDRLNEQYTLQVLQPV